MESINLSVGKTANERANSQLKKKATTYSPNLAKTPKTCYDKGNLFPSTMENTPVLCPECNHESIPVIIHKGNTTEVRCCFPVVKNGQSTQCGARLARSRQRAQTTIYT